MGLMKWSVWLFPVFSVALGAYLFYDHFQNRGPLIELRFADAAGVEVQKTTLHYRGIVVGVVEAVVLADDGKEVLVMARLDREARDLAAEGSRFSIVQPQVDFGGVRGLETLFKGPYIRVERGHGGEQYSFKGSTTDQMDDLQAGLVSFTLHTNLAESLGSGDPVTYRGMKVGSIISVKLDSTAQGIDVQIGIEKRYLKLIRMNTVFWQAVAVQAKLGLFASEIKINSFESLLKSGIAFATPNEPGKLAPRHHRFDLQKDIPKDWVNWHPVL
jgi:paraquat-inducible protein B